jgi:lipid-binding SYLF domain-containing protein
MNQETNTMMKKTCCEIFLYIRMTRLMRLLMCGLLALSYQAGQGLVIGAGSIAWAEDNVVDEQEEQDIAHQAELVILDLAAKNQWFHGHVKEAKAIFIAPQLYRGRVLTGGSGVLLVRQDDGWSQKAFYRVEVPDLGLQLGSDRVAIVLLVNTHLGLTSFYSGGFTLGSDLRIARGPMSGDSSLGDLNGDVVAFTKLQSQKTYTNLPVQGVHISVSNDFNQAYYGTTVQPKEIISTNAVSELGLSGLVSALQNQPVKSE